MMRFSEVHFHKQLEISGMPQSNRYNIRAEEGFSLELDAESAGIVARHPNLKRGAIWIPAVSVALAYILEESAPAEQASEVEFTEPEIRRGPGRPRKQVA